MVRERMDNSNRQASQMVSLVGWDWDDRHSALEELLDLVVERGQGDASRGASEYRVRLMIWGFCKGISI